MIDHLHQRIAIAVHVNFTGAGSGTHADDPSEIPHDPVAAFIAGALLGTIVDWLRHGCPGTSRQIGAAIWPQLLAVAPAGAS